MLKILDIQLYLLINKFGKPILFYYIHNMKRYYTPDELIVFETKVKEAYEAGQIKGPIHLSKNNEQQ